MIRILSVIVIAFFVSCSNFQECNDIELKIKDICVESDTVYTIPLTSLTNFEWDTLYVIAGPTVDNEAGDIIGRKDYKKIIPDGRRQYILVKGNEIVKEYSSFCNLNLSTSCIKYKCMYLNTSVIKVKKKEGEGHFIYRVEEVQN